MKLNLACGTTLVSGNGWVNLDFTPLHPDVQQADLLSPLPFATGSADLVYSSHFLEHVPRARVPDFLAECLRVLKPGGRLRLVLPDLENICRTYLQERDGGNHERADFVVLELIDQCVRQTSGGALDPYYRGLSADREAKRDLFDFVMARTGHDFDTASPPPLSPAQRLWLRLRRARIKLALSLLPPAFRAQNISRAEIGERHQWMWDFFMLSEELSKLGYCDIIRVDHLRSGFANFPVRILDATDEDRPRKGTASMYVEAVKP